MLVIWDSEYAADKNKIFKYGSIKLVIRFQKVISTNAENPSPSTAEYPDCTSIDTLPYCSKYRPLCVGGVVLVPNLDIFNFEELQEKYEFNLQSDRKEEIIIHLYKKLGLTAALSEIQGEYSFILCDEDKSYLVRDGTGTRGLCYLENRDRSGPACAAMRASLLMSSSNSSAQVRHVPVGSIIYKDKSRANWRRKFFTSVFQAPSYGGELMVLPACKNGTSTLSQIRQRLRNIIRQTVNCRSRNSAIGKVGLLLSGGLNSRILGNILRDSQVRGFKTFFVGTKTAHERVSSENGAKSIHSIHHDIMFDPKQAFDNLPKVIELIETYDTASVRKALLLFAVCKHIHEHNAIDILLCGEGLDDIAGSQIFYKQAKSAEEFQIELERNLSKPIGREIYDKVASWFGIRIVFPFLDPLFTSHYLSFSENDRIPRFGIEKYFLRSMLDHSDLISEEVLWKHREDWVDSASSYDKFWIRSLQKQCSKSLNHEDYHTKEKLYPHNTPQSPEEFYYRQVFEKTFPGQHSLVPMIYRPGLGVGSDPSPRTWAIYPQHLCVDFLATVRMMV